MHNVVKFESSRPSYISKIGGATLGSNLHDNVHPKCTVFFLISPIYLYIINHDSNY